MLRVVLDVNIFISALIAPLGIPQQLWGAWRHGRFLLVSSDPIVVTTTTKLRAPDLHRRFALAEVDVRTFDALVRARAAMVPILPDEVMPVTGDPEDDAVLATARLGQADYLVTGDRGLLALGMHEGTRIVSPRDFLMLLGQ